MNNLDTNQTVSFARWVHPWEYRLVALVLLFLYGLLVWMNDGLYDKADVFLIVSLGVLFLFCIGYLVLPSFQRITVGPDGITLSLGQFVLRKIAITNIRTIVKHNAPSKRTPLVILLVSPIPVKEMEATGECELRKNPVIREELKFRKGRSDWGDLCLGGGFYRHGLFRVKCVRNIPAWKDAIWMEFSLERQQLLQKLFAHAEYREAKRYYDPPCPQ